MLHLLDNPIWNALISGNKDIAFGESNVRYIKRDVGLFAGLQNNSPSELNDLYKILEPKSQVILFTPGEIAIPETWKVKVSRPILQMVCPDHKPAPVDRRDIIALKDKDIPAMMALTKMTNPGPFFSRTIDYGNYEGIFDGDQLIAMIGQRLRPFNYTEISAVCTDPGHTGKGYAAKLLRDQVNRIINSPGVPFLNVYPENMQACNLYKKIGFHTRKEMMVYFLERTD